MAKYYTSEVEMVNARDPVPIEILKPCPFCGGDKLERSVDGGCLPSFIVGEEADEILAKTPYVTSCELRCESCGANVEGYAVSNDSYEDIFEKAVNDCYKKWNRRNK